MSGPDLTVVVSTFNREHYLAALLAAMAAQTLDPSRFEVRVVDNGSTDGTPGVVAAFASRCANVIGMREPRPGVAHARNAGWRASRAPFVMFLDDDAVAPAGWAQACLRAFLAAGEALGCVGGPVRPAWEAPRPAWMPDPLLGYLAVVDFGSASRALGEGEWLAAVNLGFPRARLESLGGFDTVLDRTGGDLMGNGDIFLQRMLDRRGQARFYDPALAVDHHVPAARLEAGWMRRRVFWQGVCDAMLDRRFEPGRARQAARAIRRWAGAPADGMRRWNRARHAGYLFGALAR